MTATEIKSFVDEMTDEERFFVKAYLQHLDQADDPQHQAMLDQRMRRMDAGEKFSLDQLKHLSNVLETEGV